MLQQRPAMPVRVHSVMLVFELELEVRPFSRLPVDM
jgi:hypothetical protein